MTKIFRLFSALLLLTASVFGFKGTAGGLTRGAAIAAESSDDRLASAAAKVGWSLEKAKAVAARDRDLHLSADNRFFYVCRFFDPSLVGSKIQTGPDTSTYTGTRPAVDAVTAFQLHSRPGASKTLYLDFNGHTSPAGYWAANALCDWRPAGCCGFLLLGIRDYGVVTCWFLWESSIWKQPA